MGGWFGVGEGEVYGLLLITEVIGLGVTHLERKLGLPIQGCRCRCRGGMDFHVGPQWGISRRVNLRRININTTNDNTSVQVLLLVFRFHSEEYQAPIPI